MIHLIIDVCDGMPLLLEMVAKKGVFMPITLGGMVQANLLKKGLWQAYIIDGEGFEGR